MSANVMKFSFAEPDKGWGQRPCEGFLSSTQTCVSDGTVAERRTHPGLGAAWKGSNVADRFPRSNGGQHHRWSERRRIQDEKIDISSPATASEAAILAAVSMDTRRQHFSDPGSDDVWERVTDAPFLALRVGK